MCKESVVDTCERAAAKDHGADGPCGFVVGDSDITAISALLDRHFGNNRYAHAGSNHAEDTAELAALEDDLRMDSRTVASGNGGVAEAVPVAKEQKRFLAEIFQGNGAPIGERVLVGKRSEQSFGEERRCIELMAANGQGQYSDIHSAGAETLQQDGSDFFDDSDINLGKLTREK